MKQWIWLIVVCISFNLSAQTTVYKKIAQRHDVYASSAWVGVDSFRWAYNSQALLTLQNALKANTSGNWNDLYRYSYQFNSMDLVTEQIRENWNGTAWVNSTRYTYDYDANGNLLTLHYDIWNSGVWNVTGKIEYAGYNAQNKYSSVTNLIWSGSSWNFLSRDLYQYYGNGYQVLYLDKYNWNTTFLTWDSLERYYYTYNQDSISGQTHLIPNAGSWLQESRELITFSSSPFQRTEYLRQVWDTVQSPAAWKNDLRSTYTYNTNNLLQTILNEQYAGGNWNNQSKSHYAYNASNQLSEYYDELYASAWSNHTRSVYAYTGNNRTEELRFVDLGGNWDSTQKLMYTFDMNDLNTYRQIDTFNGAVFVPNNRDFYYYNSFTVNTNNLLYLIDSCTLYPNPSSNQVWLQLNSEEDFQACIQVLDLCGKTRLLIEQPIWKGSTSIPISVQSLAQGNYFVQIRDVKKGTQLVKKIQVVH